MGNATETVKAEILCQRLEQLHASSVSYWNTFDTPVFLAPIGDAWSPGDNVRHLTKAMRAVTSGLEQPRLLLRLMFGRSSHGSRDAERLRRDYLQALARGGQAGRFAPRRRASAYDIDVERQRIMSAHALAVHRLCGALRRWPERELDRLRLPHPLLGKLTVREMLLFTLYHNEHHVNVVKRRLREVK